MTVRPRHGVTERGFTISEFVLVVAVVAALIGIAVWSISGLAEAGDERECRTQLRAIKAASERFQAELGVYPPDTATLLDSGFIDTDEAPDWDVRTDGDAGEPEYLPNGSRCA